MNELDFVHRLLNGDLPTVGLGEGLFNPSVKFSGEIHTHVKIHHCTKGHLTAQGNGGKAEGSTTEMYSASENGHVVQENRSASPLRIGHVQRRFNPQFSTTSSTINGHSNSIERGSWEPSFQHRGSLMKTFGLDFMSSSLYRARADFPLRLRG